MSTLDDFNIKYLLKKHVCPFLNFQTHKKYNLNVHKTNKHRNEILNQDHNDNLQFKANEHHPQT